MNFEVRGAKKLALIVMHHLPYCYLFSRDLIFVIFKNREIKTGEKRFLRNLILTFWRSSSLLLNQYHLSAVLGAVVKPALLCWKGTYRTVFSFVLLYGSVQCHWKLLLWKLTNFGIEKKMQIRLRVD